jgi:hypothetical protein
VTGARVRHRVWGSGYVVAAEHGGYYLQVRFDDGSIRRVRASEVEASGGAPARQRRLAQRSDSVTPDPMSGRASRRRRLVEALRLGIVPRDEVPVFTFGRATEEAALKKWLRSDTPVLVVAGEYGSGKSHFLEYACYTAEQLGYAVANVELDPADTALSQPKRIYAQAMRSLRWLDHGVERDGCALAQTLWPDLASSPLLRGVSTESEEFWDWLLGADVTIETNRSVRQLPADATAGNVYTHLLSAFGHTMAVRLGRPGLLIAFDEAESIHQERTSYRHHHAWQFVRALVQVASSDTSLLEPPNPDLDLTYSRRGLARFVPFLFASPAHLKLLFAVTPDLLEWHSPLSDYERIVLDLLPEGALRELLARLTEEYTLAYSLPAAFSRPDAVERWWQSLEPCRDNVRQFAKGAVELMDMWRYEFAPTAVAR